MEMKEKVDGPGFEPGASCLQSRRSSELILPAQCARIKEVRIKRFRGQRQMAPVEASPTSRRYLANTPVGLRSTTTTLASRFFDLLLRDEQLDLPAGNVDGYAVPVLDSSDRTLVESLRRDVTDARSPGRARESCRRLSARRCWTSPFPAIRLVGESISGMPGPPLGPS